MRATLAVIRMVAAVLRDDVDNRIVARVPALALLAGDGAPRLPTAVLSQADDNVAVREAPKTGWPVVVVLEDQGGSDFDADAQIGFREGKVRILIAIMDEPAKQAEGYRTAKYLQQAIVDGIEHGLMSDALINSAGRLGEIQIQQATRLTAGQVTEEHPLGPITAAVRYEFDTRDRAV